MREVVVVHFRPNKREFEGAVVIVGVHAPSDLLVEGGVEEADRLTSKVGSLVEHENDPARIQEHDHHAHAVDALDPWVLVDLDVGLEVGEGRHEGHDGVDRLPNVLVGDGVSLLRIAGQGLQVIGVIRECFQPNVAECHNEDSLHVIRRVRKQC